MSAAPQCRHTTDGPKVGRHVVAWRRQCKNRTRHESGLCYVHRATFWYVGQHKEERDERT